MQVQGYSLDSQEHELTKAAEGYDVCRTFRVTKSAKTSERRKLFHEMVDYIKTNHIGFLFAWTHNRLTRNYQDLYIVQSLIDKYDVTVVLVKDNKVISKDSSSTDRFVFQLLGNLAEKENEDRGHESREKMQEKARQGGWPHKAPIGYLNITDPTDTNPIVERRRKTVVKDPERAPLVTWALEAFAKGGWSLGTTAAELRRRGLVTIVTPARPSHPLDPCAVHAMLKNPFYCGEMWTFGKKIKGNHEPLITKEVWLAAQARLIGNRQYDYPGKKRWFAFKPFVRCGYCLSGISAYQIKPAYRYYVCSGSAHKNNPDWYKKNLGTDRCKLRAWREENIDALIGAWLGQLYVDDFLIAEVRERLKETSREDEAAEDRERRRLRAEQERKERHLKLMYRDRLDEKITIEEYEAIRAETQMDLDRITKEFESLGRRNRKAREQGVQVLSLLRDAKKVYTEADLVGKRRLLEVMLDYIMLRGEGESFVAWKWPFNALFDIGEEFRKKEVRGPKTPI